ncbi:MAG: competence/damage-inducible protein A [Bacteroidales bacterium]
MKAEIISIGDEILTGQTIDTNAAWMATELNRLGIEVTGISAIPDDAARITRLLSNAIKRSGLVLITGGLGPTSDDITKDTLCRFFNTSLVRNDEVLANITEILGRRGVSINENNFAQANVPGNCTVLMNRMGTAPGMWFETDEAIVVSMAGVPYEMKYIMNEHVIPTLKKRGIASEIIHRNIMTYGLPEAHLAERLVSFESELPSGIRLAYLPSTGVIKLRLTARSADSHQSEQELSHQIEKLKAVIPELIYADYEVSLEELIGITLKSKGLTISTAESCTGGNISRMIISVPGSSSYYKGGVIAYSNDIKVDMLGVNAVTLENHGAVSQDCAAEMAEGVRRLTGSNVSVATTGIAGPDGGSDSKPVGTVCIAVSSDLGTETRSFIYGTDRLLNLRRFSLAALNMVREQIIRL